MPAKPSPKHLGHSHVSPHRPCGLWCCTPGEEGVAGTMADAYYGAIAQFGNSHQADPAEVLGYVVAHELGHLLLGPGIPRAAS